MVKGLVQGGLDAKFYFPQDESASGSGGERVPFITLFPNINEHLGEIIGQVGERRWDAGFLKLRI